MRDFNAKLVVIACNTAASVALHELSKELPVPVLGVVEPGARALVRATRNRKVGVIGTVGTISSGAYVRAINNTHADVTLTSAACPGFVEFVERDQTSGDEVTVLAERLLAPVRDAGVDALLLGCTHYPYLSRVIGEVMGSKVVLVSSGDETAFAVRDALIESGMAATSGVGSHRFLSSGDIAWFAQLGRRLLCKGVFKCFEVWATNEGAVSNDLLHGVINFGFDGLILCIEVNELNGHIYSVLSLAVSPRC